MIQYLLANNYFLTALELLVEAQEAGNEGDVEQLQLFFSDRVKFPPEEVAKFDQHDGEHCRRMKQLALMLYMVVTLSQPQSLVSCTSRNLDHVFMIVMVSMCTEGGMCTEGKGCNEALITALSCKAHEPSLLSC